MTGLRTTRGKDQKQKNANRTESKIDSFHKEIFVPQNSHFEGQKRPLFSVGHKKSRSQTRAASIIL